MTFINSSDQSKSLRQQLDQISEKLNFLDQEPRNSQFEEYQFNVWSQFQVLWRARIFFLLLLFFFIVISFFYVLNQSNIYRATVLVVSSQDSHGPGFSHIAGQLGGFANIAGFGIKSDGDAEITLALEILSSRKFSMQFLTKHNLLPELLAVKGWDEDKKRLVYDALMYDDMQDEWRNIEGASKWFSSYEIHKKYLRAVSYVRNKSTGFVSISVEHLSPDVAKKWLDLIIPEINSVLREKELVEAKKSIEYLEVQLSKTSVADMQSVFYQLIEEQQKKAMLAEIKYDYVFSVIDPPNRPEKVYRPNKPLLLLILTATSVMVTALIILVGARLLRSKRLLKIDSEYHGENV